MRNAMQKEKRDAKINYASSVVKSINSIYDCQKYVRGYFGEVEGWCSDCLFPVLYGIKTYQLKKSQRSGACEIGVHHGKLFFALAHLSNPEKSVAIDLFEDQARNIDLSGSGNIKRFKSNATSSGIQLEQIEIIAGDSLDITALDAGKIIDIAGQKFGFFSVDGGHTVDHVLHDVALAENMTEQGGGVIIIDDFGNPDWPGVIEGATRHLVEKRGRFAPLAYIENKLILCGISVHAELLMFLENFMHTFYSDWERKKVEYAGYKMLSIKPGRDDSFFWALEEAEILDTWSMQHLPIIPRGAVMSGTKISNLVDNASIIIPLPLTREVRRVSVLGRNLNAVFSEAALARLGEETLEAVKMKFTKDFTQLDLEIEMPLLKGRAGALELRVFKNSSDGEVAKISVLTELNDLSR